MVTERYHWLWTVIESSMVMDGFISNGCFNGCISSCAGSQEKNWLLHWMYSMLLQCSDSTRRMDTMRVENTITMLHNRLPTEFTFQCRLNFNSSTGYK